MKRMQKGICMELNGSRSVFMLANGQFVLGEPESPIDIGEEGSFHPLAHTSKRRIRPFLGTAVAAVAIMMLVFTTFMPQDGAFAYVQVQVNPGVEIGIDRDNRVISMTELNEDGIGLIEELGEWENQSLEEVLNRVLTLAPVEMADELTITTVSEGSEPAIGEIVETTVLAVAGASKNADLSVHLKKASQEQRDQAAKENVPVGQLVKDFKTLSSKEKKPGQKQQPGNHKQTEDAPLSDPPPVEPKQVKEPKEIDPIEKKPVSPPGQEKREQAPGQGKKQEAPPAQQEKKPPGQEKKQENKQPVKDNKPQVEKKEAPGQVKKEPPGQQKKEAAPGQEKKKEAPKKQQPNSSKSEGKENNSNKENKGNGNGKE